MNTKQGDHQTRQGSNVDDRKNQGSNTSRNASGRATENDDDFLSGDNEARPYPNQGNPDEGYNKQMSPGRGSNPNIGGNESEYENPTNEDEDRYNYGKSEHDDEIMNRRDNEEIDRHEDESRYSSPTTRNRSEE
jgi:hypothetical protein